MDGLSNSIKLIFFYFLLQNNGNLFFFCSKKIFVLICNVLKVFAQKLFDTKIIGGSPARQEDTKHQVSLMVFAVCLTIKKMVTII